MTTTAYDDYLERFLASRRGQTAGKYTVSNGLLVRRLSRREFAQRLAELHRRTMLYWELRRRDHTMPQALEREVRELVAQLVLPREYLRQASRRSPAAEVAQSSQ